MNFYTFFPSPIGVLTLESDGQALTALRIAGTAPAHTDFLPLWEPITQWLTRYPALFQSRWLPRGLYFKCRSGSCCKRFPGEKPPATASWPDSWKPKWEFQKCPPRLLAVR